MITPMNLLVESASLAYVGPGAGLTAIGALVAVIAAIVVALFGFVWYPLRRLRRWMKNSRTAKANEASGQGPAVEQEDSTSKQ